MAERVGGLGNNHVVNGGNKNPLRRISFSYPGILKHALSVFNPSTNQKIERNFSLTQADLEQIRDRLAKRPRSIEIVLAEQPEDKFHFKVNRGPEEDNLELTHIEHTVRSKLGMHLNPVAAIFATFKGEFKAKGIEPRIEICREENGIRKIKKAKFDALDILSLGVQKGETYTVSIKGMKAEDRQKALLDLWLAFRVFEDKDMEKETQPSEPAEERPAPQFAPTHIPNIMENGAKTSKVKTLLLTLGAALPHGEIAQDIDFPGRIIVWSFYRNFSRVREMRKKNGRTGESVQRIEEIFERMIDIYRRMSLEQTGKDSQADWHKYITIFELLRERLKAEIGGQAEVTVRQLDGFFSRERAKMTGRNQECIALAINYLVKGLIGESLENEIAEKNEPVILLTPSITPQEAAKLPGNVRLVLAPDIELASHAEIILNERKIGLYRPGGEIGKFIRRTDVNCNKQRVLASVYILGQNMWLNMHLPESLYQFHLSALRVAETGELMNLALNGLDRSIREEDAGDEKGEGRKEMVSIKANMSDIRNASNEFKKAMPDGIGLVRSEMLGIQNWKHRDAEEEFCRQLVQICDISRIELEGVEKRLPVTARLLDVSMKGKGPGGRRDTKLPGGVQNPQDLSGAEYLLSEEGLPILKTQMRAILRAHLLRRGQLRMMVPYVTRTEQFSKIRAILQEVKREIISEVQSTKEYSYGEVNLDSLRIELGAMIENDQIADAEQLEALGKEAHFFSLGLNDLRKALNVKTIFDPRMIRLIALVIEKARKTSTPISCCGKIMNTDELMLLMALGLRDISVDFGDIPRFSNTVRSFNLKELEEMREKLLSAKSMEEVIKILEAGRKHMDELIRLQVGRMAAVGRTYHHKAEHERFADIHATRIRVIGGIERIIRDLQPDKEKRILGLLHEEFKGISGRFIEFPSTEEVSKWLENEMLVLSYINEWEIREVLGLKCRCTPYIIYRSSTDGTMWARSIPHGEETGSKSRYYIEYEGVTDIDGKAQHLVKINYFNLQERVTKQTHCVLQKTDKPFCFDVNVPLGNGQTETVQLLLRKEGGKRVVYRRLKSEKLFIAKAFAGEEEAPIHPSIYSIKGGPGRLPAIFVQDRETLSQIVNAHLKAPIEEFSNSVQRDKSNVYYQAGDLKETDPYNINQSLFFEMGRLSPNRTFVIVVDNWLENRKKFQPLLDDPARLLEITQFLGAEAEESDIISSDLAEIESLRQSIRALRERNEALENLHRSNADAFKRIRSGLGVT